jgi:hypothetical protein
MEEPMSNQDFSRDSATARQQGGNKPQNMKEAANQAFGKASEFARDAGAKAKEAAADTTFTVTEQVKEMLDKQIGNGANFASQFANSFKVAADDLNQQSPFVAGLVRNFATKIEDYADDLQDQTVDHLARAAADFTRKQPALVFGLAAVAGFFMFRTVKSAQSMPSPSIQPIENGEATENYG